jgi:hypothetical protein
VNPLPHCILFGGMQAVTKSVTITENNILGLFILLLFKDRKKSDALARTGRSKSAMAERLTGDNDGN